MANRLLQENLGTGTDNRAVPETPVDSDRYGEWRDDPNCTDRTPNRFGSENCVVHVI